MHSSAVTNMPSSLTHYARPLQLKKVGRKVRDFRRKPRPNILNRPTPTYSIERHKLRLIIPRRATELVEATLEMRWLAEHGHEYIGQWVALDGGRLLSHGDNARDVYDAARRAGVNLPLVVRVDVGEQFPFGGW